MSAVRPLPTGRLYPIDFRWAAFQRLWVGDSILGKPVTDELILTELTGLISDLQQVLSEIQTPKGEWLD